MPEKRKHVRVARTDTVRLDADGTRVEGNITDISATGMRVIAPFGQNGSSSDKVLVTFPDLDHSVAIPVRIARATGNSRDGSIGLQFEFEADEQRELISAFVRGAKEREILHEGPQANARKLPRASCTIDSVHAGTVRAKIRSIDNVSTDGFLASYTGTMDVGERLALEFTLPSDTRKIRAEVSVVYSESNPFDERSSAGLRIEQIGEIDRTRLRNFIVHASSGGTLRTMHNWIAQQGLESSFHVSGRDEVIRYIGLLISSGALIHLVPAHGHEVRTGIVTAFDARGWTLTFEISTGRPIDPAETTLFGSFVADAGSFYFSVATRTVSLEEVQCEAPHRLYRSEQRSYGRKVLEQGSEFVLMLEGAEPREVPARLVDISLRGFLCEVPADPALLAHLEGLVSVHYRLSDSLGLDSEGEIRHLQTDSTGTDGGGSPVIRIGIEAGVRRGNADQRWISDDEWLALPAYQDQIPFLDLPGAVSSVVRYPDSRGRMICALVNSAGLPVSTTTTAPETEATGAVTERPEATVFIVPPAFGKKKEALAPLAAVLTANFARQDEPVVVIRYDGIDRPGESDSVYRDMARGYEMLHYRTSTGRADLEASLGYVHNNAQFRPSRVVLVTFSMSALDARKLLADRASRGRVDYWISVMGVPTAQTALRNTLGGLDVIGNFKMGIPTGVCGLLGHLVDTDRLAQDLIEQRYAHITDARVDMATIDVPVLWLYGRHDMWVTSLEVEDIMSVAAPAGRQIVQIPAGHNLRTSDDALRTFKLIASYSFAQLFGREPDLGDPNKDELMELITAERERLDQRYAPEPVQYWHDYLVGRGEPGSGYDFYRNLTDFRRFLRREAELLDVKTGMSVADMGCGTGLYLEQLFRLHGQQYAAGDCASARDVSVTAVDLVTEALASAQSKVEEILKGAEAPAGWSIRFQQADLDPSRLLPVRDLIDDHTVSLPSLRGRIEGLTGTICHELSDDPGGHLGRYARGIDGLLPAPRTAGNRILSLAARQALSDLNIAACYLRHGQNGGLAPAFSRLSFGSLERPATYAFTDASFDRLNASLFISYLFNPDYAVTEFYRMLRPGGRVVLSSMRPDSDISVIFTEYVGETTQTYAAGTALRDAREMLNEAAELFELEEEGHFKFFDADELGEMLVAAGFINIHTESSLGNPSQAVIAVGEKPR